MISSYENQIDNWGSEALITDTNTPIVGQDSFGVLSFAAIYGQSLNLFIELQGVGDNATLMVRDEESHVNVSSLLKETTKIQITGSNLDDRFTLNFNNPAIISMIDFDGGGGNLGLTTDKTRITLS